MSHLLQQVTIRPMTEADITDVVRAEQEKPAWTAKQFEEELQQPCAWQLVACLPDNGRFAGYVCCRSVADEAEIVKIAVSESLRRRGIAGNLLDAALDTMCRQGIARCYLEVRQSNNAARRLYEKKGFRQEGLRRNYYSSPREDALVFAASLSSSL